MARSEDNVNRPSKRRKRRTGLNPSLFSGRPGKGPTVWVASSTPALERLQAELLLALRRVWVEQLTQVWRAYLRLLDFDDLKVIVDVWHERPWRYLVEPIQLGEWMPRPGTE